MLERPSGEVTSVEKMASQESTSKVSLCERSSAAGKGREGCMSGGPVS